VLSVLQKLEKAGWLEHRAEGRAYVYRAKQSRRQEGSSALWQFVDGVFRGDPTLLFEHLIEGDRLDDTDLAALRKMIDAKRQERSNGE
jgi:predicted transcriptional regulator